MSHGKPAGGKGAKGAKRADSAFEHISLESVLPTHLKVRSRPKKTASPLFFLSLLTSPSFSPQGASSDEIRRAIEANGTTYVLDAAMVNLRCSLPLLAAAMAATSQVLANLFKQADAVHSEASRLRDGLRHLIPLTRYDGLIYTHPLADADGEDKGEGPSGTQNHGEDEDDVQMATPAGSKDDGEDGEAASVEKALDTNEGPEDEDS